MPRPKAYLQQLRQAYPAEHKVDLIHLVKKECSGNLERCLVAALRTDAENRAQVSNSETWLSNLVLIFGVK